MKRTFIFLLFSVFCLNASAQRNVIKGRIAVLPDFDTDGFLHSAGIGYEHLLNKHWSMQLLANYYYLPFDERFEVSTPGSFLSFGGASKNTEIIPEIRYYFGKKENFKSNTFLGAFVNFRTKKNSDIDGSTDFFGGGFMFNQIEKIQDRCIGLLVGQNLPIRRNLYLDIYIGGSYNFVSKTILRSANLNNFIEKSQEKKGRMGLNVCYLF